jgi:RNA polymerase-interacting CarD/CdnL/TRCF family regulator
MENILPIYSLGDIVIHRNYGVGKIESIETKTLEGKSIECFKVETENGSFWFPVDTIDNPRINPAASLDLIQKARTILATPPEILETDPATWKDRIDNTRAEGDFLKISAIVRDLSLLKTVQKLNRTQEQALNNFEDRLVREWAGSLQLAVSLMRQEVKENLEKCKLNFKNSE